MNLNEFKILKFLGRGSFADVYLVKNIFSNELFAMKKISYNPQKDNNMKMEIEYYKMFNHRNIIKIYDYKISKNFIYILLEYAENGTLQDLINNCKKNNKKLSNNKIMNIILQITKSLQVLHSNNVIHRDLKPANILIDKNYTIKICDLGICKKLFNHQHAATTIGTPYYMSPEIINGNYYREEIDYWSLGCILYEMIYLEKLFKANNYLNLFYQIVKFNPKKKFINTDTIYKKLLVGLLDKNKNFRYNYYQINQFFKKNYTIIINKKITIKKIKKSSFSNINKYYLPPINKF